MSLTRKHRKNLLKLADYLESLPRRYKHFEMEVFTNLERTDENQYARKNGGLGQFGCSSVACAVGHGPSAGILHTPKTIERGYVDWSTYAKINFVGADEEDFTDNDMFSWLFGEDWSCIDNHHWGAAARIRFILAGRRIPFDDDGDVRCDKASRRLYAEFRKK